MPNDTDLTDQLSELLIEAAEAFLRTVQDNHRGPGAEYEIAVAVRRRVIPSP